MLKFFIQKYFASDIVVRRKACQLIIYAYNVRRRYVIPFLLKAYVGNQEQEPPQYYHIAILPYK